MIRRIFFSFVLLSLLLVPAVGFAYDSGICAAALCVEKEVGPLMVGITKECGNLGNCTLDDIMTVFVNAANYVLGVVGIIVLLMYVIGGIYMLTSSGKQERVTKGKKYLTVSTMGLIIVMCAYLGILSLKGALTVGDFGAYSTADGLYNCTEDTIGQPCDLNSKCSKDLVCVSACKERYGAQTTVETSETETVTTTRECIDTKTYSTNTSDSSYTTGACDADLCPGDTNYKCCVVVKKSAGSK